MNKQFKGSRFRAFAIDKTLRRYRRLSVDALWNALRYAGGDTTIE
jgi:hypothetical protein